VSVDDNDQDDDEFNTSKNVPSKMGIQIFDELHHDQSIAPAPVSPEIDVHSSTDGKLTGVANCGEQAGGMFMYDH
jgi:hypothetical protein